MRLVKMKRVAHHNQKFGWVIKKVSDKYTGGQPTNLFIKHTFLGKISRDVGVYAGKERIFIYKNYVSFSFLTYTSCFNIWVSSCKVVSKKYNCCFFFY